MEMIKQPITETRLCFDPQAINNLLMRIDTDPEIGPKGISQISFYNDVINTLRYGGKMMNITTEIDVPAPETSPTPPAEGVPVWTPNDDASDESDESAAESDTSASVD